MLDRVRRTIDRYRMLARGMRVGVAVSGGADSVCLLRVLAELAPELDLKFTVLHLNHNLRGEESRGDARFVETLAAGLGIPAIVRDAHPGCAADNLEQAARRARLAFFREAMASERLDRVALGHTRSDQAETVLYRFLRGAGSAGLAGIRPVTSEGLIRPLIEIERADVERYLRERGISWRDDSTNASLAFARNRIRHDLLPQLAREWNPGIRSTLAHAADWALAEESYWEGEIDRIAQGRLSTADGAVLLSVDAIRDLPVAAARRLIRRAMEMVKGDLRSIDFAHVAAVVDLASKRRGSGRVRAPGIDICRSFDWLRFVISGVDVPACEGTVAVAVPGTAALPGAASGISLELVEKSETLEPFESVYNEGMGLLDWSRVSGPLELRAWRPGDQYQPCGSAGEKKVKTLFQNARIPLWERRNWPILTGGASIIWAQRFGPAARLAANAGSKVILVIREIGIGKRRGGV